MVFLHLNYKHLRMLFNLPWQIMLLHSFIFSKDLSEHCPSFRFTHNTAFTHDGITGVGCKTISEAPSETSHYPTSSKLFPFSIHTNKGKGYNSFGKMVKFSFRFDARTFLYIHLHLSPCLPAVCSTLSNVPVSSTQKHDEIVFYVNQPKKYTMVSWSLEIRTNDTYQRKMIQRHSHFHDPHAACTTAPLQRANCLCNSLSSEKTTSKCFLHCNLALVCCVLSRTQFKSKEHINTAAAEKPKPSGWFRIFAGSLAKIDREEAKICNLSGLSSPSLNFKQSSIFRWTCLRLLCLRLNDILFFRSFVHVCTAHDTMLGLSRST